MLSWQQHWARMRPVFASLIKMMLRTRFVPEVTQHTAAPNRAFPPLLNMRSPVNRRSSKINIMIFVEYDDVCLTCAVYEHSYIVRCNYILAYFVISTCILSLLVMAEIV